MVVKRVKADGRICGRVGAQSSHERLHRFDSFSDQTIYCLGVLNEMNDSKCS